MEDGAVNTPVATLKTATFLYFINVVAALVVALVFALNMFSVETKVSGQLLGLKLDTADRYWGLSKNRDEITAHVFLTPKKQSAALYGVSDISAEKDGQIWFAHLQYKITGQDSIDNLASNIIEDNKLLMQSPTKSSADIKFVNSSDFKFMTDLGLSNRVFGLHERDAVFLAIFFLLSLFFLVVVFCGAASRRSTRSGLLISLLTVLYCCFAYVQYTSFPNVEKLTVYQAFMDEKSS